MCCGQCLANSEALDRVGHEVRDNAAARFEESREYGGLVTIGRIHEGRDNIRRTKSMSVGILMSRRV